MNGFWLLAGAIAAAVVIGHNKANPDVPVPAINAEWDYLWPQRPIPEQPLYRNRPGGLSRPDYPWPPQYRNRR